MNLTPCPECRRHVRDRTCPFCGARVDREAPPAVWLGRVSRAVVFGAALTACGGKHKPADRSDGERHHGGGGCTDPDQARVDELKKQRAAAQTDEEKRALDQEIEQAQRPVCMPYGAPPQRRRFV